MWHDDLFVCGLVQLTDSGVYLYVTIWGSNSSAAEDDWRFWLLPFDGCTDEQHARNLPFDFVVFMSPEELPE